MLVACSAEEEAAVSDAASDAQARIAAADRRMSRRRIGRTARESPSTLISRIRDLPLLGFESDLDEHSVAVPGYRADAQLVAGAGSHQRRRHFEAGRIRRQVERQHLLRISRFILQFQEDLCG